MPFFRSHVLVSVDPHCLALGAHEIIDSLNDELVALGLIDEVQVLETSRIGDPDRYGPDLVVYPEGTHYVSLTSDDIPFLVEEHFLKGRVVEKFTVREVVVVDEELGPPKAKEVRVVLRNCGKIDPLNIEEYIAEDGYLGLGKVLSEMTPEQVIETVMASGLRGRGGAGFPAARKWQLCRQNPGDQKYVICNADEGDPGAFMNRRVLESDPHSVIEGMIIAAYAIGSSQGYIYCRAEYPIAVHNLRVAIKQARGLGLLGNNLMGSDFNFDLEVRMGAGAFVCGEETALMASIEGRRGEPRPRPPFPAQRGLWGKPSNINNVETYANVPQIILRGPEWFASMGTERSKGTKTFAIAGDVINTGLIEVPMGITLREIVYDVGGGIKDGKALKAIQSGGPMGGCLPVSLIDLPVDYEVAPGSRRYDGLGRHDHYGRRHLHGGHRPLLHGIYPGRKLRKMHTLPGGHSPLARDPGADLRRQRPRRRPGAARPSLQPDPNHQPVRAGPGRAEPGRQHPGAFPGRICGPYLRKALPGAGLPGPDQIRN